MKFIFNVSHFIQNAWKEESMIQQDVASWTIGEQYYNLPAGPKNIGATLYIFYFKGQYIWYPWFGVAHVMHFR